VGVVVGPLREKTRDKLTDRDAYSGENNPDVTTPERRGNTFLGENLWLLGGGLGGGRGVGIEI